MSDADRENSRKLVEEKIKEAERLRLIREQGANTTRVIKIVVFVVIGSILLYYCNKGSSAENEPRGEKCSDSISAQIAAKNFVEKKLKSPSTADWCSFTEFTAVQRDGLWVVDGCLDSQNGFGALIRSDFTVSMTCNPENWLLVDIKLR